MTLFGLVIYAHGRPLQC